MKSVCFFASYFTGNNLPYYITVYLKELKKHFSEVVLLTSQKELSQQSRQFLTAETIQLLTEDNDGFDFGMWYKAFKKFDVASYDKITLVNDSCVLFKPLDEFISWAKANTADIQGMTLSEAVAPHIQSYFLVLNKKAVLLTTEYFEKNGILRNISDVIRTYEIGLSTHLLSKGLTMAAFVDNNGYKGEFSPYYQCIKYHLSKGIPVIKKKILFTSYRRDEQFTLARMNFNIDPEYYIHLIKEQKKNTIIDFDRLRSDKTDSMDAASKIKYAFNRRFIKLVRSFRK
ncbi:MAG: rhamnan synthesis F family protein [Bacteroidia bacterium]